MSIPGMPSPVERSVTRPATEPEQVGIRPNSRRIGPPVSRTRSPLVPRTTIAKFWAVKLGPARNVSSDVPDVATVGGSNVAVTPSGSAGADSATGPVKPLVLTTLTVKLTFAFGTSVAVAGSMASAKSRTVVTVAVSTARPPFGSVARSEIVNVSPASQVPPQITRRTCSALSDGSGPTASSNSPSPSRSHCWTRISCSPVSRSIAVPVSSSGEPMPTA